MKAPLFILYFLFALGSSFAQSVYTNMRGDTIVNPLAETKSIVVFLSDRSCTGCKDNLNNLLLTIDTTKCKIILVSDLQANSFILRREQKLYIDSYFTKYNKLVFVYAKNSSISPHLLLLNKQESITIDYKDLFNGTALSDEAIKRINLFLDK